MQEPKSNFDPNKNNLVVINEINNDINDAISLPEMESVNNIDEINVLNGIDEIHLNEICLVDDSNRINDTDGIDDIDEKEKENENDEAPTLLPASLEQQCIIDSTLNSKNVIIDAVAGSGKTTTILHIAKAFLDKDIQDMRDKKSILLITYNSKLKIETRQKKILFNLSNIEIHSYHSFGYKYYDPNCQTDAGIINLLKDKSAMSIKQFRYDMIILDELQDMSPLYYEFALKLISDMQNKNQLTTNIQICLFGDKFQSIYKFNNADNRYLIHAEQLFNFVNGDFENFCLSQSFRLTSNMANFINHCLLGSERIIAKKTNNKPVKYIISNTFDTLNNKICAEIELQLKHYNPTDIFILAPSLKNTTTNPIRIIANSLAASNIPIYVPGGDDDKIDEQIIKGKVCFLTFHQSKGLERPVSVVYNFDESYFKYYSRNLDQTQCPNELYVAVTRASELLILVHHYANDFLPFLKSDILEDWADVLVYRNIKYSDPNKAKINDKKNDISVTDITKKIKSNILDLVKSNLKIKQLKKATVQIVIPTIIEQQNGLYENVSEITGTVIPAYFEYLRTNSLILAEDKTMTQPSKKTKMGMDNLLKIATEYCARRSGLNYKLKQIDNYNWLSRSILNRCVKRLDKHISPDAIFEVEVSNFEVIANKKLLGCIDCIDKNIIWEFKCVKSLSTEHYIQLALYGYMYEKANKKRLECRLMNVLSNEVYKVEYDNNTIEFFLNEYADEDVVEDNLFIEKMLNIRKKYFHHHKIY